MKIAQRYYLILTLITLSARCPAHKQAVVKVPVADACGLEMGSCTKQITDYYATLPYAPDSGSYGCLRIHQLLFNELVTITKEYPGGEVGVEFSGFFFLDGLHRKRHDFWMLKKDLVLVNSVPQRLRKYIPPPVDYEKPIEEFSKNVLVLSAPWFDEKTNQIYSVGTRFLRQLEKDTETEYGVSLVSFEKKAAISALVPKEKALVYAAKSFDASLQTFLSLIRSWAHQKGGFIPYVYGGCSFRELLHDVSYSKISGTKCHAKASYWDRPAVSSIVPHSGFDCSNMILRAAQMSFMPYYFKNTLTLIKYLRPLKLGEKLEEGDLVWYSGHVMIVSNVEKNLLIEAIGYDSGYGRVHELSVRQAFHGMKNFEQLIHAHHARQFMYRLNSSGGLWRSVYRLRIFKLRSILETTY